MKVENRTLEFWLGLTPRPKHRAVSAQTWLGPPLQQNPTADVLFAAWWLALTAVCLPFYLLAGVALALAL
jgi:hypothetical protein